MNTLLKTGFAVALCAVCLLGISAITAEPAYALPPCPTTECGGTEGLYFVSACTYLNWGTYRPPLQKNLSMTAR